MIWMNERGLLNSIELRMKVGSVNFKPFVFLLVRACNHLFPISLSFSNP